MLLVKDGELWGKKTLPPKDLSKFGWHENGPHLDEHQIDEKF
jgi:hypothetical protein